MEKNANIYKEVSLMENYQIENQDLLLALSEKGAELIRIYDKKRERDVLWDANPAFWARHAPILFPNVGRHYGNTYQVDGHTYPSKQHGFARDSVFTLVKREDASITQALSSSEETKETYPFDFLLTVCHTLNCRQITVSWTVTNTGNVPMYFTIGGHPAFRVPVLPGTSQKDYLLQFRKERAVSYHLIDPATGTALPKTYSLELEDGTCPIGEHLFDHDALIFDDEIDYAGIAFPDGTPYLSLEADGFSNFGIWSVPGAPFVCLEPWMGRCDDYGFTGELKDKKWIQSLAPGKTFSAQYRITLS